MNKITVDGLVLRDVSLSVPTGYFVHGVPGLEAPGYRVGMYDKPGEDGAKITTALYGSRPFTISGSVQTADVVTQEAARVALARAFRIQRDKYNYPTLTRIDLTTLDGGTYFFYAQVKDFKNPLGLPTSSQFIAALVAPDPAIYASGLVTTSQVGIQVGGGVTFPLIFPLTFTAGSGGTGSINNTGNLNSYPLIYLRGALTNPRIYAIEQAGTMALSYTTSSSSDVIVIDMANKTIMLNGSVSLLQYKTTDSNWFSLAPEVNTFQFTTGSSGNTGTMEATAYPAVIGL